MGSARPVSSVRRSGFDHYEFPGLRMHEVCGLERSLQVGCGAQFLGITGILGEPDDTKNGFF